MSLLTKRMTATRRHIRRLREKELAEKSPLKHRFYWAWRWVLMVYHEYLNDDVRIRAESLAFLMIFSLLPLIAGGFFVFGVFAKFGMVQEAIQGLVDRFVLTIPAEHSAFVLEYIIKFKDAYLESIEKQSGTIGIFALFILIWVGLQAFNNVDRTLNRIWSSERHTPFLEKFRNFLVVSIGAPLVLISALSVPLVLKKSELFQDATWLVTWVSAVISPLLIFGTFLCIYKYVPVRKVWWKSAIMGTIFSTIFLQLANKAVEIYFRFGMNTAYGKAAAIPLIGFWIYLVWIIVILGAEVSFLVQNQKDLLASTEREPSFKEGEGLMTVLCELYRAYQQGKAPVEFDRLMELTKVTASQLHGILDYLNERGLAIECIAPEQSFEGSYVLAREAGHLKISDLLVPYLHFQEKDLKRWLDYFKDLTLRDLSGRKS